MALNPTPDFWWLFDEGSGDLAASSGSDVSDDWTMNRIGGDQYTAWLASGRPWGSGGIAGGINFNNSAVTNARSYMRLPLGTELPIGGQQKLTYAFWANPLNPPGGDGDLFCQGYDFSGSGNRQFTIFIYDNFWRSIVNGQGQGAMVPTTFGADVHLVFVVDFTLSSGQLKVYQDGNQTPVFTGDLPGSAFNPNSSYQPNLQCLIGARSRSLNRQRNGFKGDTADHRLWFEAATPEEVTQIYENTLGDVGTPTAVTQANVATAEASSYNHQIDVVAATEITQQTVSVGEAWGYEHGVDVEVVRAVTQTQQSLLEGAGYTHNVNVADQTNVTQQIVSRAEAFGYGHTVDIEVGTFVTQQIISRAETAGLTHNVDSEIGLHIIQQTISTADTAGYKSTVVASTSPDQTNVGQQNTSAVEASGYGHTVTGSAVDVPVDVIQASTLFAEARGYGHNADAAYETAVVQQSAGMGTAEHRGPHSVDQEQRTAVFQDPVAQAETESYLASVEAAVEQFIAQQELSSAAGQAFSPHVVEAAAPTIVQQANSGQGEARGYTHSSFAGISQLAPSHARICVVQGTPRIFVVQ